MTAARSVSEPREDALPTPEWTGADLDSLHAIEERVLWLSASMVHHANRVRPNPSALKVGGHQSSSASMVTIMTALWLAKLEAGDRVSVKPHASPALHSLNYRDCPQFG